MWPEDFLAIIDSFWGRRKGIQNFAKYTGFTRTTVERWANGSSPVPIHIALLVLYMQREVISRKGDRKKLRPADDLLKIDADWLPGTPKKGIARTPYP